MATDLKFTFRRPCLELSGEVGSLAELIGYMQEESASLTLAFGSDMELVVQSINAPKQPEPVADAAAPPKERKPRATKEAVAPPPLAVPQTAVLPPNALNPAPPPQTVAMTSADGGIPPGLKRDVNNEAPAMVSPPLAPLPPVAPPPGPPPVGVLGPKVVAALDALRVGKADDGMPLSDWLAASGLTQKGAAYDDACRAVLMISDEKLKGVAEALKVS